MAKHGPGNAWCYVDGLPLGEHCVELAAKKEGVTEESTTLGDTWQEHAPVGLRRLEVSAGGFYEDTTTTGSDQILSGTQHTSRVVCLGFEGTATLGAKFLGAEGMYAGTYERQPQRNSLHRFAAQFRVSGQVDECVVVQELEAKTADWNTEGADSQDNGASTANGAAAYMQVTAFSGFSNFVGKIRHSADDSTYADLITFSAVTSGPAARRGTSAGTVNRHLAFAGDVTGTGSITLIAGVARL